MKRRNSKDPTVVASHLPPQSVLSSTVTTRRQWVTADADSVGPLPHRYSQGPSSSASVASWNETNTEPTNDFFNYALLIVLYTLQGIPMGLSASIPFLIQQKFKVLASTAAASSATAATSLLLSSMAPSPHSTSSAAAAVYNANAIFALCSWPFSLKLLWAPIVDSVFLRSIGRRKTWLVPVQTMAGVLMVTGSNFVERQLGLQVADSLNVRGLTAFFFALYFLMATQDIAVDGWALTMLSKKNRGRGPVCNSIGQNIGYFISFVGFLALNDAESSESVWRPLFRLPSNPSVGLVSLGGFLRFMGYIMIVTTAAVALFKSEKITTGSNLSLHQQPQQRSYDIMKAGRNDIPEEEHELDASEIGLRETYHRLWAVCKLPAVRWLFVILLTYRLPTALADNVKFLKAVDLGLSKSVTALLSPTVILPLGIIVPIIATRIWHGHPLCGQFMTAYRIRVTLVPLLDALMLLTLRRGRPATKQGLIGWWSVIILSTAAQAIVSSLQFNAQMTFFAHRVDPAIGGSYMTLLNTAANLGGTWPASFIMWLIGRLSTEPTCNTLFSSSSDPDAVPQMICTGGRDPYFGLQFVFSIIGCFWIFWFGPQVQRLAALPDDAWRTHLLDNETTDAYYDEELGSVTNISRNIRGNAPKAE